ncbi:molybdenum cofactor guanylyltransferase [Deferribacterales bacterium Es71-Z0220]|jgi:molybdopterin-guanine dinucleotide biosynthesis protein A|uniref:molybdenum cofactor guanylyltransferase n=1 Tax=Deferrivibrio essentukiensis TaxID=2880922 RepID=UPI001F61A42C|nr:molybdenum cofactor guanylyltransferase [Deferrivibrio essentukiensis]MCB4204429.1 molybdenum cofactor guanylyltransferase [Deferrivibrio essentukiensis]
MNKFSCAILAGGQSRRFGRDKTVAEINNKSLTEILASKLCKISDDVMVISKDSSKFIFSLNQVRFLNDFTDSQSPLVGIITALQNAKHDKVFIVSADTPFLSLELVSFLYKFADEYDSVLTQINGKINTLCGFYRKKILQTLLNFFNENNYRLIDIYTHINTKFISDVNEIKKYDSELLSFININTPEDYEYAKKVAKKFGIGI